MLLGLLGGHWTADDETHHQVWIKLEKIDRRRRFIRGSEPLPFLSFFDQFLCFMGGMLRYGIFFWFGLLVRVTV